jgi:hypothetical protein
MKKLLLLPLLLVTYFCLSQDAKAIIGKPITIGNLLVAQNDFPKQMKWQDAKKACENLGRGWRLPTKDELHILYQNYVKIGVYSNNFYWSSTEFVFESAWVQYFGNGGQLYINKSETSYVRAIRAF